MDQTHDPGAAPSGDRDGARPGEPAGESADERLRR